MTGPITNTGDPTIKMGKANFGTGNLNTGDATFVAGLLNTASGYTATVGGGQNNTASNTYTTVSGGVFNNAIAYAATVGGGYADTASGQYATVGGGIGNIASGLNATVGGGRGNTAINQSAVVCGGEENSASNSYASVGGGLANAASGSYATVGGGSNNTASGAYATIGGGDLDTAAGSGSYAVGNHSVVPSAFSLSAAFNGQAATASMQLRCGTLAKVGGSFTIDHPVDPNSKILNHYFVESPDMSNIYSGSAMLDANGRAEVRLPDYFDALNRNPRIQLTGVGTYEIFVAEKVNGNRFVIGGKPGTEVFWQVTGDRKDQSAEIIRTMMPVEQPKTGALAGRMLDDDFLVGCMKQLEEMGKAGQFNFRTAEGQRRFEEMKRQLLEHKNKNK